MNRYLGQSKLHFIKHCTTILLIFNYFFFIVPKNANSKIDPPNYNFSFEELAIFKPGTILSDIQKKYGEGEIMDKNVTVELRKFYVTHLRYKFPVIVQFFEGKVVDSYARLPSYFLHNVFHQTLIDKLGPQKSYLNKDGTSKYQWKDTQGISYLYEGACTITCFPIFFYMQLETFPKGSEMAKPIINRLQNSKL